jgi:subtilisin family serine protease
MLLFLAPGVMVLSLGLLRNGEYQFAFYSGTSMPTPHVAADAALLWSYFLIVRQLKFDMQWLAPQKTKANVAVIITMFMVSFKKKTRITF